MMRSIPEGAFGPTNNCVGIGSSAGVAIGSSSSSRRSFAGILEAQGFEEWLMRLTPRRRVNGKG